MRHEHSASSMALCNTEKKNKTTKSWKERLLDSWHQPRYLRPSSCDIAPQNQAGASKSQPRKRRALSAIRQPYTQTHCSFLSRVPGELRNAVYLLILGNGLLEIHYSSIVASKHRLQHREYCREEDNGFYGSPHPPSNKLALLQTCRQIYTEACGVLYTTNGFLIRGLRYGVKAFNLFARAASPSRLACIASLTICCEVDIFEPRHPLASKTFERWKKMWNAISVQMPGLRNLTLQLQGLFSLANRNNTLVTADSYWVKPFLRVRNLDTFEITTDRSHYPMSHDYVPVPNPVRGKSPYYEAIEDKIERLRQHSQQLLCSPG